VRIVVQQADLRGALDRVVPGMRPSPVPALANVLLESRDGELVLTAGDLEISVTVRIPARVEGPGTLALPATALRGLVRTLGEGEVEITASGGIGSLVAGVCRVDLPSQHADEYPRLPSVLYDGASLPASTFHFLAEHVAYAAAQVDGGISALRGVLLRFRDGELQACATDGRRLSTARAEMGSEWAGTFDAIVPPRTLESLRRGLSEDERVEVGRADGGQRLGFRAAGTEVVSSLLEGPYPSFEQVLPGDPRTIVTVSRAALLDEVSRLVLVANERTHRVEVSFDGAVARFRASDAARGGVQSRLDVEARGPAITVALNGRFLAETLARIPCDRVEIALTEPLKAIRLRPVKASVPGWYLVNILMPLKPHG
jgi:DNA polymerase III subunit beta